MTLAPPRWLAGSIPARGADEQQGGMMYRIIKLSGAFYGVEIADLDDAAEDIEAFLSEGRPVILVENLEDLDHCGLKISSEEIRVVESEN